MDRDRLAHEGDEAWLMAASDALRAELDRGLGLFAFLVELGAGRTTAVLICSKSAARQSEAAKARWA